MTVKAPDQDKLCVAINPTHSAEERASALEAAFPLDAWWQLQHKRLAEGKEMSPLAMDVIKTHLDATEDT